MKKYTNRAGIAERYHLSLGSVKNMMRKRILPFVKIGRVIRFDIEKCDRAMEAFELNSVVLSPIGKGNDTLTTADQAAILK